MRTLITRAGWVGFGLAIGLVAVCEADETPKILVTSFYDARVAIYDAGVASAPRAPNLEARFAARLETVAGGRARAVLRANGDSNLRFEANEIRAMAASAGATYVLVGEWLPAKSSDDDARVLEAAVELRSGHSGAAEHRYRLAWGSSPHAAGVDPNDPVEKARDAELERVAQAMLQDLRLAPEPEGPGPVAAPPEAAQLSAPSATGKMSGKRTDFLNVKRDQPIEIKSDELELFTEGNTKQLIFSKHVLATQGEMRLFAGHLEAFYPDGASQPERMNASENVRVIEGDLEVRCIEATYLREDGLVICRGDALLLQGCDEVRGREIVFYLDEERVTVKGAASVVLQLDQDDPSSCRSRGAG